MTDTAGLGLQLFLLQLGGLDVSIQNLPHVCVQPSVDLGKAVVECAKLHAVKRLFRHHGLVDRGYEHRPVLGL